MRINFKYKLFLSLIVILLITVTTISAIWYTHTRKMITDNILESTELLLDERNREIGKTIMSIDYQSRLLSFNNANVDRGLGNKWNDVYLNNQANKKLNSYLDSVYSGSLNIQAIELGNKKGDFYGRGMRRGYSFLEEQGIDVLLEQHPNELLVLPYFDKGDNIKEIMFLRNILYYDKIIGYSMISIDYSTFEESFEGIFPKNSLVIVKNTQDQYLYTSRNYASIENDAIKQLFAESVPAKQLIKDSLNEQWLVIGKPAASNHMLVQVAVPIEDIVSNIKSKFEDIIYITILMFAPLLLIVFLASNYISRNVSALSRALKRFSNGDMNQTLTIRSKDEFSMAAESFNQMTQDIKQLLEDVKANEKEKMELEIRALQGQINLHFLFNTLNTIKNLSYIQRVTNIERLVSALMELLNMSMVDGKNTITLESEITYVEHYLEIYRYKSVKDFECTIDMDEDVKHAIIPKFMLQPIVENAIIHGIEARDDDRKGLIYIKVFKNEQDIDITVFDNGQGFDVGEGNPFSGIGIANTDKRIKVHYGEEYGIRVESVPNESTTVKMRVPFRKDTL